MTVKTLTVSGLNVAAQVLGGTGLTSSTTNGVTTLSVSGTQASGTSFLNPTAGSYSELYVASNDRSLTLGQRSSTNTGGDLAYLYTATATPMSFWTSATERMRITAAGNVGIGTSSPYATLHLHNTVTSGESIIKFTNNNGTVTSGSTASDGLNIGFDSTGNSTIWNYEASATVFGTNASERMRITSAGKVGIGTTTPSAYGALTVAGDVFVGPVGSGGYGRLAYNTTLVSLQSNVYWNGTNNLSSVAGYSSLLDLRLDDGSIRFSTSASVAVNTALVMTERMIITASGNVGIGTSSPGQALSVSGNIRSTGEFITTGMNGLRIGTFMLRNDGSNTYFLYGTSDTAGDNWNTLRPMYIANSTGSIYFGHDIIQNTTSGFLYIKGTLSFDGITSGYVRLKASSSAGSATYTLPTAVPAATGYALTSTTGGIMSWVSLTTGTVTSVAALNIDTTGTDVGSSVATGTTTPVITLNIPTASAANRGALSAADWTTFNGKTTLAAVVAATNSWAGTQTFANATYSALFTGGNVGIGTTSPGGKLHVWGESYLGGSVSGNTAILLRNLSGQNRIDSYDYPITQNYPLSILGSYIILSTTDTERVRITNNGVGIGTASPGYRLHVVTAAGGTSFAATDNTNSSVYIKHAASLPVTFGTDAGGAMAFATNGFTERMRIDASGNVGIGTTTPDGLLGFKNTATFADKLVHFPLSTYTLFLRPTGTGGQLQMWSDQTNANVMTWTTAGNVGIGTTSPQANLHVTSPGFNVAYFTNGTFASSSNSTLLIGGGDAGFAGWENVFLGIYKYGSTSGLGSSATLSRIRFDSTAVMLTSDNGGSYTLYAGSSGTYAGRVGIGTSSPAQLLHVAGRTLIGGATTNALWDINADSMGINRNISTGAIYDTTGHGYQWQHTKSTTAASNKLTLEVYTPAGVGVAGGMTITGAGNVGIGTADPKSTLHVSGSQSVKVSLALASTTLDATHYIITTPATGNIGYTLPSASTAANRVYMIKRLTTGTVIITPASGDSIETGAANATFSIPAQYDSYTFVSDGTSKWYII